MGTPAPDSVKRLIDRFDQNRKVFLSGDYKEEQLRAEFLNLFFTALGWDTDNRQGLSDLSARNAQAETFRPSFAKRRQGLDATTLSPSPRLAADVGRRLMARRP
jgi:hypothetical protein